MGEIRLAAVLGGAVLTIGACAGPAVNNQPTPDARAIPDAFEAPDAPFEADARPPPDAMVSPDAGPAASCGDGVREDDEVCLAAPIVIDGGGFVFSARLADVDGDGVRDLVWLTLDHIVWARGDGHGGFAPAIAGPATVSDQLAIGDLDLDGVPDLVAAGRDEMDVWCGQGGGVFGAPITRSLATPASGLEVADFDGYPGDEIALASGGIQVYRLTSPTTIAPMSGGLDDDIVSLRARDVDGDYKADAIVVDPYEMRVLRGDAGGLGASAAEKAGPYADAAYGDLDGDAIPDAIIAQPSPPLIVTNRAGDFSWAEQDVSSLGAPHFVDATDLEGNGRAQVIAGFPAAASIAVLKWGASGSLTPIATVALPDRMTALHADGDVNGDGLADLVITLPQQIVVVETAAP